MNECGDPSWARAREYAAKHELHALLVEHQGAILLEEYGAAAGASSAHPLYSGTKSFWGVAAVAAQQDGLLSLDEPVAATIESWRADARKARVTVRELLSLTSGLPFGGLGNAVPTYEAALAKDVIHEPGSTFTYGGLPLQVFGAVMSAKLAALKRGPHDYLLERILEPAGVRVSRWRTLRDGTHPLPTGAFMTARNWLAYGRLILHAGVGNGAAIVPSTSLAACFTPTAANPRYGLGWWLSPLAARPDIVYASGAGGQALYVIPSRELIAVHFGRSSSWRHETFLRRLLEAVH